MLGDKTLLQYIMEEELRKFKETHQVIYQNVKNTLEDKSGAFLIEINSASTAFQKILDESFRSTIASLSCRQTDDYRSQLGQKIIKLEGSRTFSDAITLVYKTYKLAPEPFAGVIFITADGGLVNPLHPLVALELLKKHIIVSKIFIFSYKDLSTIKTVYGDSDPSIFDTSINTLMRMYQSQIQDRSIKMIQNEFNTSSGNLEQKYQVSKFSGEDQQKEYYLIAHQLLTKGTYVPYYGTSLIQMNGTTSGYHLTPFKSCNINGHNKSGPVSVCTGSTSNKTIKGLRTLHHANLNSPYEYNCMTNLSYPYAIACIKKSFDIFLAAKFIKE